MTRDEFMEAARRVLTPGIIGESVHTSLRKCDAVSDMKVWNAIRDMPGDQWHAAMEWVADALLEYIERGLDSGDATCSLCDAECSGHH
jgi:hypothetical protein